MEEVILDTSDEAAKRMTVTGWVSRHGRFFGEDEYLARYDGSTHRKCKQCENVIPKHGYTICPECLRRKANERFKSMEVKKWDAKTPLCIFDSGEFFWNEEDIEYYCDTYGIKAEDLKLVICEPIYAKEVDAEEHFFDDLPEDNKDIPDMLADALEELNKVIREYKEPLSWVQGKYRAEL